MSGVQVPLRDLYAALFGERPGPEVGAACDRLDLYLRSQPMGTASLMIVIALRPLDLFVGATTAAERQLRDAQLAFDTRAGEARSNEQHVIARMANALSKSQEYNERLRQIIVWQDSRGRHLTKMVFIAAVVVVSIVIATITKVIF